MCSRGEWSDHCSHHPVSAAPRHPRQRPLLPAQERQTPLWAFGEARDVSNRPAFISGVKVWAVSCSRDANLTSESSVWLLNVLLFQQHQRDKHQRRDCCGDEDRHQDRRKRPPEGRQWGQEGSRPTDDRGQYDIIIHTETNAAVLEAEEQDGEHNRKVI